MNADAEKTLKSAFGDINQSNEKIAEKLHISVRSYQNYIAGKQQPPCDVIAQAVKEFGLNDLAINHLSCCCPIGKIYFNGVDVVPLPQAVLRLQKELSDVDFIRNKIIDIACDGRVDSEESEEWQYRIERELKEAISALLSVIIAGRG